MEQRNGKLEQRTYIDHVCCWPVIVDVRLDLELWAGLLEEGARRERWTLVEVGRAGDIDV